MTQWIEYYDWLAALATVAVTLGIIGIGRAFFFRVPAIRDAVRKDAEQNHEKQTHKDKFYRGRVRTTRSIGIWLNLAFAVLVLPFIATLAPQSVGKVVLDMLLILLVYDFLYYLMHRFVFHGIGFFRKVHGVHHMARSRVSSVDAYLLHPIEMLMGLALYYLVTTGLVLATGERLQVTTLALGYAVYTQLNIINHCRVDLDRFPWKTLNWVAMKHDAHHLSMSHGNYATITLLFDWLFGTLEVHPREGPGGAALGGR
ncbi:MAG: sterol desaturase family protein [Gammaproteobacteria bacterium]|nr:sterol desaturase family protein [Gammaproteobacteria bacterium]MCY4276894.1 sterol desaturase family protein [Gammaproteobacteria bacterium]